MINLAEVQGLFKTCSGPVDMDLFERSIQTLDAYSISDYPEELEIVINSLEDATAGELCEKLLAKVKAIMIEVLNAQGIVLMPDQMHSDVIELCRATLEFPYYEDKQAMFDILGLMESDVEIYAQLCNLVSGLSVEKILTMVEKLEMDDFVDKVTTLLNQPQDIEDEADLEIDPKIVNAWKAYKQTYPNANTSMADGFVQYSEAIGLEFDFYLTQYLQALGNIDLEFNDEVAVAVAENLVGLACISSDANAMPVQVIRSHLNRVSHELKNITKIDSLVSKLVMGIGRGQV